jgi:V-type H+-transporting ATPase proteolipid subunit
MCSIVLQTYYGGGTAYSMFGYLGVSASMAFSCMGAAYGTARAGAGLASMGVLSPNVVMRCMIPVVMAGVLGIYGLIISVILLQNISNFDSTYTAFGAFAQMGAGLACGLSCVSAGYSIGILGDYGVRGVAKQSQIYVGMILMLIFSEALALYGLIVAIILAQKN